MESSEAVAFGLVPGSLGTGACYSMLGVLGLEPQVPGSLELEASMLGVSEPLLEALGLEPESLELEAS